MIKAKENVFGDTWLTQDGDNHTHATDFNAEFGRNEAGN